MGESSKLRLSVLDIGPIRSGQTSSDALDAMMALALRAEQLGYRRYWFAEHHNVMGTVASSTPLLAMAVAAKTKTIRVGGNVLLQHYPPFLVAENAAILEACYPGRVDLALGASAGTDEVTSYYLRGGAPSNAEYADKVRELLLMLDPQGVRIALQQMSPAYTLRATPLAVGRPQFWIWGTGREDAIMAGRLGLSFLYCYHIVGRQAMDAVRVYKENFVPAAEGQRPQAMVSAIVIAGRNLADAEAMAAPHLRTMAAFRSGTLTSPQPYIEEFEELLPVERQTKSLENMFRETWIIGDGASAAGQVRGLAAEMGVEEVLINPVAAAFRDDLKSRAANREYTLEALASAL